MDKAQRIMDWYGKECRPWAYNKNYTDYRDIALKVIAVMTHFHNGDGEIEDINDIIYTISHSFQCDSDTCRQKARNEIAKQIKIFRSMRYDFFYNPVSNWKPKEDK